MHHSGQWTILILAWNNRTLLVKALEIIKPKFLDIEIKHCFPHGKLIELTSQVLFKYGKPYIL